MAAKKKKTCKQCGKSKPIGEFPRSASAKDGHLGYCEVCWPKKIKAGFSAAKKPARKTAKKPHANGKHIEMANDALKAALASKEAAECFLVRADRKDYLAEFDTEDKALRQAMDWKMRGLSVTIWRQCQFEMVVRIIG